MRSTAVQMWTTVLLLSLVGPGPARADDAAPKEVAEAGRLRDATYLNGALGLRLALPADRWCRVPGAAWSLVSLAPRAQAGVLTLGAVPLDGRPLRAVVTVVSAGKPLQAVAPALLEGTFAGRRALRSTRTSEVTLSPRSAAATVVHDEVLVDLGRWALRLLWTSHPDDARPWAEVEGALATGLSGAAFEAPPVAPLTKEAARARVAASGKVVRRVWTNEALGVSLALPADYQPSRARSAGVLLQAVGPGGARLSVSLHGAGQHPAHVARMVASEAPADAEVERQPLAGHDAATIRAVHTVQGLQVRQVTRAITVEGHVLVVTWAGPIGDRTGDALVASLELLPPAEEAR
jgi:hypothetical protein